MSIIKVLKSNAKAYQASESQLALPDDHVLAVAFQPSKLYLGEGGPPKITLFAKNKIFSYVFYIFIYITPFTKQGGVCMCLQDYDPFFDFNSDF